MGGRDETDGGGGHAGETGSRDGAGRKQEGSVEPEDEEGARPAHAIIHNAVR